MFFLILFRTDTVKPMPFWFFSGPILSNQCLFQYCFEPILQGEVLQLITMFYIVLRTRSCCLGSYCEGVIDHRMIHPGKGSISAFTCTSPELVPRDILGCRIRYWGLKCLELTSRGQNLGKSEISQFHFLHLFYKRNRLSAAAAAA